MNTHKYPYLWDSSHIEQGNHCSSCEKVDGRNHHLHSSSSTKRFRNPFNKGCWANVFDRLLNPSEKSYLLDEQMESLLVTQPRSVRDQGATIGDPNAV
jgi:hypothetical protein